MRRTLLLLSWLVSAGGASDVWQARAPITAPGLEREACLWVNITHYAAAGVAPYAQCVRHGMDAMSVRIASAGRWADCDGLVDLWRETAGATAGGDGGGGGGGVFVDAGANIGACSLMMLGLGATTVAFEPLPLNLFYFTSSVLAHGDRRVRERLTLHALALGNASGRVTMFSQPGNRGNSAVGQPIGDTDAREAAMRARDFSGAAFAHVRGTMQVEFEVAIARLDDVLWPRGAPPPPPVRLLKADVQGFEPRLFEGARRLLSAGLVRVIKFELTERWLVRQNGPGAIGALLRQLRGYGYSLRFEDGRRVTRRGAHEELARRGLAVDVIARRL